MLMKTKTSYVTELQPHLHKKASASSTSALTLSSEVTIAEPIRGLNECRLPWYTQWLHYRVSRCPKTLFSALTGGSDLDGNDLLAQLQQLMHRIAQLLNESNISSADDLLIRLLEEGALSVQDETSGDSATDARHLIFAALGWLTMLYRCDAGSSHSSQLAIASDMDGFSGQSQIVLQTPLSSSRKPFPKMLMDFGVMLPPRNFPARKERSTPDAPATIRVTDSTQLNAYMLSNLASVHIRWVDSLPCHLEFNEASATLFLYRFPSFCISNRGVRDQDLGVARAPIFAFATSTGIPQQWARPEDVDQLLQEMLLSFRLLFGCNKKSRQAFRRLSPFQELPKGCCDPLLEELCGRKRCDPGLEIQERELYSLTDDFPMLGGRLAVLQNFISQRRPKTWRQLWVDKRDSGQWYTFWAVLITGGTAVILAFIQVVLQILQFCIKTPS